ncbi:MAG: redoxin domain-containing protein [Alphaproteobacteria bacterium]|nr:MAG: redoxin domain-containing protein [Alphaproteobacteria bacterium]
MKSILLSLALVIGLAHAAAAAPQIGAPAPAFSGINTKGETISLADFAGQKVVLEWTNHDCPFVVKHYGSGNMQRTQAALTDAGYVWLTIISSAPGKQGYVSPEKADQLTASRGAYTDHVILDPEGTIGHAYEAKTTPHMFIIDEQQILQYMGAIDSIRSARQSDIPKATNYVLAAYEALNSGEPVAETSTRAYGCSVKYK